ncbi:MAG: hypothetical protein JW940_24820 [Polyangiaceae bacterium]|nr:hypothetical protein [Polyangiaceae bacterium]
MADERKSKIDLKSRLRKQTVSSPIGSSIPPPVVGAGIPAPPFGSRPKVDASNPYSAVEASVAPPKPQAIRVEMSQEVVDAQKKGRSKVIAGAFAAALVGSVMGFAVGGGCERDRTAKLALTGAHDLAKEVEEATAQAEQLADTLRSAGSTLSDGKFPEEEVRKLGGLRIPFEGANLANKGMGRFSGQLVTMLIDFTAKSEAANDQKDRVQRLLGGSRKAIEELLSQAKNPKIRWSVFVGYGPSGPWASMQPLPEPFLVKSDEKKDGKAYSWPAEFTIKDAGKDVKLNRYTKGNPIASPPELIPVDPESQALVCPVDTMMKLAREVQALQTVLRGQKAAQPGEEEQTGLIDAGTALVEKLKQVGQPS